MNASLTVLLFLCAAALQLIVLDFYQIAKRLPYHRDLF
jgi:hypothetical protein